MPCLLPVTYLLLSHLFSGGQENPWQQRFLYFFEKQGCENVFLFEYSLLSPVKGLNELRGCIDVPPVRVSRVSRNERMGD